MQTIDIEPTIDQNMEQDIDIHIENYVPSQRGLVQNEFNWLLLNEIRDEVEAALPEHIKRGTETGRL